MSHICRVRVAKVTYESPEICPFMVEMSLREMARRTKLDVGYLSRIKNGHIAITAETLQKLYSAEDLSAKPATELLEK